MSRLGVAQDDEGSRFSDAQQAFILKQRRDGITVSDICRKASLSHSTYFN
jgi:putative transposase